MKNLKKIYLAYQSKILFGIEIYGAAIKKNMEKRTFKMLGFITVYGFNVFKDWYYL